MQPGYINLERFLLSGKIGMGCNSEPRARLDNFFKEIFVTLQ